MRPNIVQRTLNAVLQPLYVTEQKRFPSQDGFVVRIYTMSSDPALQQELQLKLARKCLHACGISLFDLEKDLHIISKWSKMSKRSCGPCLSQAYTCHTRVTLWAC